MKLKLISLAILATSSLANAAGYDSEYVGEKTINIQSTNQAQFMDNILDKIEKGAKKKIASLLLNAIFGSSGPNYATLSQESLQQIENIVNSSILEADVRRALADLDSLDDGITFYNSLLTSGSEDFFYLTGLDNEARDLINEYIFKQAGNEDFFLLTGSYATVVTLAMAIKTELYLKGRISQSTLKSYAGQYKKKLQVLVNEATSHVHSKVYGNLVPDDGFESRAVIYDLFESSQPDYVSVPPSREGLEELYDRIDNRREYYISNIVGEARSVLATLDRVENN
ncbi:hypothetical protein [Pseudoalteromonas piscicida]|uniref:Uncharacterized protein n=1 Tax=Pseudoalteromonas piscicida TaxID=43662 RepID=A0A2A5JTE7_PSEO7|nr:hypothetical protein [Pseudoalteromonas piscicida]PCK32670.1 hypothetical protein CEX98_05455 [Pseudoalteromonas piscicida]